MGDFDRPSLRRKVRLDGTLPARMLGLVTPRDEHRLGAALPLSSNGMRLMQLVSFVLCAFVPIAARAEVLDKQFSLPTVAAFAISGAVAGFLAARYRPWLLALILPPVALFFGLHLSEFFVPHVGQAILAEGGATYVVISWGGAFTVLACCALGFAARGRHGKTSD